VQFSQFKPLRHFRYDIILSCLLAFCLVLAYNKIEDVAQDNNYAHLSIEKSLPEYMFGYDITQFYMESGLIKSGDVVGNILNDHGVKHSVISKLSEKARKVFSLRNIRTNRKFHVLKRDECGVACAFIYEPGPLNYVVYNLEGETDVKIYEREYYTCTDLATGTIESSLWNALTDQNINPGVIDLMENALASSVDFYHTQKGDEFKLIYERKFIGNEEVGLGQLQGAFYKNDLGEHYAVYYNHENFDGYYDFEGRPATSSFLRSPVKFSRISSSYNLRRFHPIKRRRIPHLGTDYAAPYGTPIRAVADGVVEKASRTRNNGNYVKIRHDKTYQTQYLHMQKFASGIRSGRKVKQGQTIGYVGSTGLATGPHVCFRFWKNGRQVNHRREVFKPADPLPSDEIPRFFKQRDVVKDQLDNILSASEQLAEKKKEA
jgi:murein DD-endopeptidase MepM/ murein hydrolase activator NlpD